MWAILTAWFYTTIIIYCHDSHVYCTLWISLILKVFMLLCCLWISCWLCLLCIQATVFLKYLPNWTTWIVLVAISLYGSCAYLHVHVHVISCIHTCTCVYLEVILYVHVHCSTTLLLIRTLYFHYHPVCTSSTYRSLCCSLSQGSSENSGGDCQRERHEHISFSHLLL